MDLFVDIAKKPEYYANLPIAIVACGVPGSGKTTTLKQMVGEDLYFQHVVSTDCYIDYYALTRGKTYNEVFQEAIADAQKHMINKMQQLIKQRRLILWDQTNITNKKRSSIVANLSETHQLLLMVFDVPPEIVRRQLQKREQEIGKGIPTHVQKSMQENFSKEDVDTKPFSSVWRWSTNSGSRTDGREVVG